MLKQKHPSEQGVHLDQARRRQMEKRLVVVGRYRPREGRGGQAANLPVFPTTGYMAHNCVSATARAATELGYDTCVARDAVGDRDIPGATADELVRVVIACFLMQVMDAPKLS